MNPPAEPAPHINRGMITATVMLTSILQTLDNTIANVALPHMQGSLSATQEQMMWVLTSYIVATAIMTPATGWLASRFGRKRLFLVSVAGFTLTSMMCGLAQTLPEIVMFRFLQGASGAALVPMSQAVLFDINPPERHGRAMSAWGLGVLLGPMLGPDSRWLAHGQLQLALGVLHQRAVRNTRLPAACSRSCRRAAVASSRFDFIGFALLAIAVGRTAADARSWTTARLVRLTRRSVSRPRVAGLRVLPVHRALPDEQEPFIIPALFRDRNYVTGNVFVFLIGVVLFATLALLPTLLQTLLDYPAYYAGWLTAPRSIGSLVAMLIVGRLVGRVDPRAHDRPRFSLTAVVALADDQDQSADGRPLVVWSGIIQGFGIGIVYVPLATIAFATLPPAFLNEGTALFSLIRNIGSSVGISAVQALLTINTQIMHASSSRTVIAVQPRGARSCSSRSSSRRHAGAVALNGEITRQAAMIAYIDDFKLMTIVTICALPLLWSENQVAADPPRTAPSSRHRIARRYTGAVAPVAQWIERPPPKR